MVDMGRSVSQAFWITPLTCKPVAGVILDLGDIAGNKQQLLG